MPIPRRVVVTRVIVRVIVALPRPIRQRLITIGLSLGAKR